MGEEEESDSDKSDSNVDENDDDGDDDVHDSYDDIDGDNDGGCDGDTGVGNQGGETATNDVEVQVADPETQQRLKGS